MQQKLNNLLVAYPELLEKKIYSTLPVKRLDELGMRRSEYAAKTHLLYKAPSRKAHFTVPGLWIHPDDLLHVENKVKELQNVRDALQKKYLLAAQQKAALVQQQKQNYVESMKKKLAALAEIALEDIAIDIYALVQDEKADQEITVAHIVGKLASTLTTEPMPCVIGAPELCENHPYQVCYITSSLLPCAAKYHLSLLTKELLRPLLQNNEKEFLEQRNTLLLAAEKQFAALYRQWEVSRPSWFSAKSLVQWAMHSVAAPDNFQAQHPVFSLPSVLNLKQSSFGKWHATKVAVSVNFANLATTLWAQATLPNNKLTLFMEDYLHRIIAEQLQEWLPIFEVKHPFDVEAARMEYTQEDWRALLRQCLHAGVVNRLDKDAWFAASGDVLEIKLQKRRETLAVKRCKDDLPPAMIDMFPLARRMNRRFTFIHGPTNSGKTYEALKILKESASGVYLGPLRLLALEIFDSLNMDGVPTNLLTGEIEQPIPGAQHTSSTIEMLNYKQMVDTAVIDEVQMLACPDRGSAWLQAILGAPAKHVVLVGSDAALHAVRELTAITKEPLTEIAKTRLNPLKIMDRQVKIGQLSPGSALIVFSRKEALSLATHLREMGKTVAVIYGALSPDVRTEQARLFRSGEAQFLVATDAIGMGLNLPVHTVVFTQSSKFDGQRISPVSAALVQQIGGRAGRYGMEKVGYVGALDGPTLNHIKKSFSNQIPAVKAPYKFALMGEVADSIARHIGSEQAHDVLTFFDKQLPLEPWMNARVTADQYLLAQYVDRFPQFSLAVKLLLSGAPAVVKGQIDFDFCRMVQALIEQKPNKPRLLDQTPLHMSLQEMEAHVQKLTLYCWMQQRFPSVFTHKEEAQELLKVFNKAILASLSKSAAKRCSSCSKSLPWNHAFNLCQKCYIDDRNSFERVPFGSKDFFAQLGY